MDRFEFRRIHEREAKPGGVGQPTLVRNPIQTPQTCLEHLRRSQE
jgi:hypothetical protein